MNIFYLDSDPVKCAEMHCDRHVVKMILEYAQLLSTAHHLCDWKTPNNIDSRLYKSTHINHPSAVWARASNNNYTWLNCLFNALSREYTYRYGKTHETFNKLGRILQILPTNISVNYLTPVPQCMPDEYKDEKSAVQAYRNYYLSDKASFATWTRREKPDWFQYKVN